MRPGCNSHVAETLAVTKVGFDTGCYHGLDPVAVCRMYEQIAGWPPMGARLAKAYPWASMTSTVTYLADGGFREDLVLGGPLPDIHLNLLWCTVPDVVRYACGLPTHCRAAARGRQCAPRGDSAATLERFAEWHPFLVHLPLAFVLQDGAERPGMVPWDAAGVTAMFVGGSDRWRYGAACADPRSGGSPARAACALWADLEPVEDPLHPLDRRDVVRFKSLLAVA